MTPYATRHSSARPSSLPVLQVVLLGLLLALAASSAQAYQLYTSASCGSGKHWNKDPTFGFGDKSFPTAFYRDSVKHPAHRIGQVDGQTFDVKEWKMRSTVSVANTKNDIWRGPLWGKNKDALMWTVRMSFFCHLTETDIILNSDHSYRHGTPATYGLDYWTTGRSWDGKKFVRTPVLHELLHATGLVHVSNSYAIQNYGRFPWQNGDDQTRMAEPLADDRRGLRALYGNGGSESDLSVLNTWYDPDMLDNGAATQRRLCLPSGGTGFNDNPFDAYCSNVNLDTTVCPGERVYTRYAIVNHGTSQADITERLYFSTDGHLGGDMASPTVWQRSISKNVRAAHSFIVPNLPPGTYWPILEVSGPFEESYRNNWIPLSGQISVPLSCGGGGGGDGGWNGSP